VSAGDWRVEGTGCGKRRDVQRRANRWAVDVRDGDLDVNIISSDIHCECLTKVRGECGQLVKSKVPTDNIATATG
jgi:hypothetical protein